MWSAVNGWSPVIITGRMPAVRHWATASRTSLRGGSIMPVMPTKINSRSIPSSVAPGGRESSGRMAKPSTRMPSSAIRSLAAVIRRCHEASRGSITPSFQTRSVTVSNESTAPLQNATYSPCGMTRASSARGSSASTGLSACMVVIRLRSDVNGTSCTRGIRSSR